MGYPALGSIVNNINSIISSVFPPIGGQPQTPFRAMDFKSVNNVLYSRALSGRVQTRSFSSQYFEWKLQFVPMTHEQFKPIYSFITNMGGRLSPFRVTIPTLPHGGTLTTGTADGTLGQKQLTVNGTGTLKAGDYISFNDNSGEHWKVYMITSDATISGSGTVDIFPGLIKSVSSQTFYTGSDIEFLARLKNDVQSYSLDQTNFYEFELEMEETF